MSIEAPVKKDIRTLIVDDQDDIRLLLRIIIERENAGLRVVGEASSAAEAVDRVGDLDPVVIVLDERMPDRNGLSALEELKADRPYQLVILCSAYLDEDVIGRARELGVSAWIGKDQMHVLPTLIRNVANGTGED